MKIKKREIIDEYEVWSPDSEGNEYNETWMARKISSFLYDPATKGAVRVVAYRIDDPEAEC